MTETSKTIVYQSNLSEILARRQAILEFEAALSKVSGAVFGDSELAPLSHMFAEGMYIRQIFLPKGTICTGKIHKESHPTIMLSGDITVYTEESGPVRMNKPQVFVSPPGVKRIGVAHEDTVWVTIHLNPTNTQDLNELEDWIIAKDYSELPCGKDRGALCHS